MASEGLVIDQSITQRPESREEKKVVGLIRGQTSKRYNYLQVSLAKMSQKVLPLPKGIGENISCLYYNIFVSL